MHPDMHPTGLSASDIIDLLDLEPLPDEGGMFRQFWRTTEGTAIYFLVTPDDFSAMHRLDRPEIWHHYLGAPLQLVLLHPDGSVSLPVVGTDLRGGEQPAAVVEPGVWMGAFPLGPWSLVGTTMAPPFNPDGFELGIRTDLVDRYPDVADAITRLTRTEDQ